MSHTDKDRPYWVRLNDGTEPVEVMHDHTRLGQPIYRITYVRDDGGNIIYDEVAITREAWRRQWGSMIPYPYVGPRITGWSYRRAGETEWIDVRAPSEASGNIEEWRRHVSKNVPTERIARRERVLIGYMPETCDADCEAKKGWRHLQACWKWLPYYAGIPTKRRSPNKSSRLHQKAARTTERAALRQASLAYTPDEDDWWGDELEDAQTRLKMHESNWWD